MCDPSTNGIISAEVCKADEAQENIPQSPVESVSGKISSPFIRNRFLLALHICQSSINKLHDFNT